MRPDLPSLLPLVCPRCRRVDERGLDMHTVSLAESLRVAPDGEILDGELRCDNAACGARYPILDGIPIVTADVPALLEAQRAAALAPPDPALLAALAAHGPDGAEVPRLLEHLSIYLEAHWGDHTRPTLDPAGYAFATDLAALAPAGRVVEIGCSVGRALHEQARGAELCVGLEMHLGALRAARALLSAAPGALHRFARRRTGRHYTLCDIACPAPSRNVALVCTDALDPPLPPGGFGRAVALNVVDSVRDPGQLLLVLDGLLDPGGQLVLASPYAWQTEVVVESARPDTAEPATWLRERLASGRGLRARYLVEEERDVEWRLRRDDRSTAVYQSHYLRATKARPLA